MNSKTIKSAAASGRPATAVSPSRGRAGAGALATTYQQGRTLVRATERRGGCATLPAPQRILQPHRPDRTPTPAGNPSAPPTNADDLGRGLPRWQFLQLGKACPHRRGCLRRDARGDALTRQPRARRRPR
jgi:hypothetical protein